MRRETRYQNERINELEERIRELEQERERDE
jgi:hypothetical protein